MRIVAIYIRNNLPPVGFKTLRRVVDKPRRDFAVNGNAVVVVERDQFIELPRAGQCTGFVADAFHQTTVAHKHIDMVVDDGVAVAVELSRQKLFRQRHTYRVGQTLAQRTCGGFDAGRHAHFRMARSFTVELAEVFQLLHGQVVARQMQKRVNQHGSVAVGEHKAVAVAPMRVAGVVVQMLAPQSDCDIGHAHGRARMS